MRNMLTARSHRAFAAVLVTILISLLLGGSAIPVSAISDNPSPYAIIHYFRADGDYGDHTTGDFNDFWGVLG
jgi:hypothetical protein